MNVGQLEVAFIKALPTMQDDVSFKVQETTDGVFMIALGKRSLPWQRRFCQITIGTWGMTDEEVGELIDLAVKDLCGQAEYRDFFVQPVVDRSPNPYWKNRAEDVVAPTRPPLSELEGKVRELEEQLARSDRVLNAIQEALAA